MIRLREGEELAGASHAGADMAGASHARSNVAGTMSQQACAANVRRTDIRQWVPTCVGITGPSNSDERQL